MADIRKAYCQFLETKTAVTDLVTTSRIRPQWAPMDETEPFIVVRVVSGESDQDLGGGSGSALTRLQIDCYAATATAATTLREAVRVNTRPSKAATWGDVTITDVGHENFGERAEPPIDGSNRPRYVAHFDLMVSHLEAVPA